MRTTLSLDDDLMPRVKIYAESRDISLGLVIHKKGRLATTDGAVLALLPRKSPELERVAVV